jgi:hypothetical protein
VGGNPSPTRAKDAKASGIDTISGSETIYRPVFNDQFTGQTEKA